MQPATAFDVFPSLQELASTLPADQCELPTHRRHRRLSTNLQQPDFNRPFQMRTDACSRAVGACLEQIQCSCKNPEHVAPALDPNSDGINSILVSIPSSSDCRHVPRPVAFFSRKLHGGEGKGQRNWHTRDKETFAIIAGLIKLRPWLSTSARRCQIWTDHKALINWVSEKMDTMSGPMERRGRWRQFLSTANIQLLYTPGGSHLIADVASRLMYPAGLQETCLQGTEEGRQYWEDQDAELKVWAEEQMALED